MYFYIGLVVILSTITYITYWVDKKKSIQGAWRIKEKTLLFLSFFFGAIGGFLAMYQFKHKTKHWYFVIIHILSILLHIALGYVIFLWT